MTVRVLGNQTNHRGRGLDGHIIAYTIKCGGRAMSSNFDKSIDLVVETCLAVQLRMLNRVVTNVYDEVLRPLGLKASQMNILVAAHKMRIARPADVCARLHLDVSTLSRNVERMKD